MNQNYSAICCHNRLKRINKDFVRCLDCGQSMISQRQISGNKTEKDFVKENNSFIRNFDRNFNNELEETDEFSDKPLYEYYIDRYGVNKVIVNKKVQFYSNPPKLEVQINGSKTYLPQTDIEKLLMKINAIRINKCQFKQHERAERAERADRDYRLKKLKK